MNHRLKLLYLEQLPTETLQQELIHIEQEIATLQKIEQEREKRIKKEWEEYEKKQKEYYEQHPELKTLSETSHFSCPMERIAGYHDPLEEKIKQKNIIQDILNKREKETQSQFKNEIISFILFLTLIALICAINKLIT